MLKMGDPIKIEEIAKKLIKLYGLQVGIEDNKNMIQIKYTGLAKGEKMHEDLFDVEKFSSTSHGDIFIIKDINNKKFDVNNIIEKFKEFILISDNNKIRALLNDICK